MFMVTSIKKLLIALFLLVQIVDRLHWYVQNGDTVGTHGSWLLLIRLAVSICTIFVVTLMRLDSELNLFSFFSSIMVLGT